MALTPDFTNKVIHSDASITDMVAFHDALRDIEVSDAGMLAPVIHTYKEVPLGGGAIFPALAFINGWTLQFPAGNFTVKGGNLSATINPVAGCYVDRTQSAAYAVTASGGGGGVTPEDVASAVRAELATELARLLDLAKINGLVPGTDAVVTATGRTAGDVSQTISEAAGTVTVSRD